MNMKKNRLAAIILVLMTGALVFSSQMMAQAPRGGNASGGSGNGEEAGIKGFWEIELQGGSFLARLDTISSVSQHQYVVDGAAKVFEVTVDTTGSQTARFYYIEVVGEGSPLAIGKNALDRMKSVAEGVTDRSGTGEVWTQVIKHYPTTTHARTAEFRVEAVEILDKIYQHIHRVWAREKGRGKSNKLRINPEKK